jgi:hypothetical protein
MQGIDLKRKDSGSIPATPLKSKPQQAYFVGIFH